MLPRVLFLRPRSPPTSADSPTTHTPSSRRAYPQVKMAKYFGDIAKGCKDILSGGISYDNKFNVSTKVGGHSVKADIVSKGVDVTASATGTYAIAKDFTADCTVNEKGDVKGTMAHAGLVKGLRTTVSGEPANAAKTLKVANQFLHGPVGVKLDVSGVVSGAPKVDMSALWNVGQWSLGAETAVGKNGVANYALAAQTKIDDVVAAIVLADKLETLKASATYKLDSNTSLAAEAVYKLKSRDLKVCAGVATTLENGHAARAVLSSSGNAQVTYSGEVTKGLQGTACAQVDQALKYKYGLQFNYKM